MTATIPLSLLTEYVTASPSRRKSIIENLLDPKPFITNRYSDAAAAIAYDLKNAGGACTTLAQPITTLNGKMNGTLPEWQQQNAKLCVDVLQKLMSSPPAFRPSNSEILNNDNGPGWIEIAGLRVNVRPEAILRVEVGNEQLIGAVKYYLAKTAQLSKARAGYIGCLLHWYCETHLSNFGNAHYKMSKIIDVHGGTVREAPRAKIQNRNNITAACEEIALRLAAA